MKNSNVQVELYLERFNVVGDILSPFKKFIEILE